MSYGSTAVTFSLDRESRLRRRIDRITEERDLALMERDTFRRLLGAGRPYNRRCVYCGKPRIRGLACAEHRDLLLLDPVYTPDAEQTNAAAASVGTDSAATASTKGA